MNGLRTLLAATLLVAMGASAALAQETFDVELTIDPVDSVDPRTGLVTITGTVTCSEPAAFANVFVNLIQPVGRKDSVQAAFGTDVECDVTPTPFERTIVAFDGRFGAGRATIFADVFACDLDFFECASDQVILAVRLSPERLD